MTNRLSHCRCMAVLLLSAMTTLTHAQPKGPPPGQGPGDGDGPDPDPRLGDTSTLMETVPLPASVDDCGKDPGHARLLCLSALLIDSASEELLELIQYDYDVETAQIWSNLPAGAVPDRPGVYLGEFTLEQRGLVKAIMMEATGNTENEGFDEMLQTLNADDYIGTVSTDYKAGYSSFNTKFAFLGTPSENGTWQLYYGGHHLAFANTYTDGVLVGATPSFRGVEPFPAFEMNARNNVPMLQERDALAALLKSLSESQLQVALLDGTYRDILAGPGADDAIPAEQEGLPVSELDKAQQFLLTTAIETYIGDINAADAAVYLNRYISEYTDTVIGYSGTTAVNSEDDYVRVHGPSLWLEFSLQSNKSTPAEGNHPHSVWRDQQDDYGGNL